jgi:hypothetical protein
MTQLSNGARKIVAPWSSRAAFVVCGVRDAWNCSGVYLEGVEQVAPAEKRTRSKYDREYQVQGDEL